MTQKSKRRDATLDALKNLVIEHGWKKHAWYLYRYCTQAPQFIVSLHISRRKKDHKINGVFEIHSVELHRVSHFLWGYGDGKFDKLPDKKLTAGQNLNDYRACALFATQESVALDEECQGPILKLVDEISLQICDAYTSIPKLVDLYEAQKCFIGPLLCMYIFLNEFDKARELLRGDGVTARSGGGDVRYGAYRYLEAQAHTRPSA